MTHGEAFTHLQDIIWWAKGGTFRRIAEQEERFAGTRDGGMLPADCLQEVDMEKLKKIFWAGDSTVQTNKITTYPVTGIGQVFYLYTRDDVEIVNFARNGRSTKSFIDEGRLGQIEAQIGSGDFLFVQFGHNDEKSEDPARYTDPGTTYRENLSRFIEAARRHGAYPVLITPLERRCFQEDSDILGPGDHSRYVEAVKQTALEQKAAMVDLYGMSRREMEAAGREASRKWFMNLEPGEYPNFPEGKADNTHLKYEGAFFFAGLIAKGLKELGGVYSELII